MLGKVKKAKKDWKKILRAFEPEWYQDMEIMEAFIQSLLEEQLDEIIQELEWMFIQAVDYGVDQAEGKKGWYEVKYEKVEKFISKLKAKND